MFSDFTVFEGLFCHTDESAREEEGQASQQGTAGGLTAVSDLGTPESGPKQVHLPQYPLSQFGAQQRAFNKAWFEQFKWLEYSVPETAHFVFHVAYTEGKTFALIKMHSVALGFQIGRGLWNPSGSMKEVPSTFPP